MGIQRIDAPMLQRAFLAAAAGLEAKKEWINELNVFPVPDGDTGTNMTLTIMAAAEEVAALKEPGMKELARAISSGSLRGARGNSGVILSQLLRGFTKEIEDTEAIDAQVLARAMARGTETAYKAVMKPKEGTILTVARGMSDRAAKLASEAGDLEQMIEEIIRCGQEVLNQTPEMLPVLKQAGVVDSGGQGLMEAVKGAYDGLTGKGEELRLEASARSGRMQQEGQGREAMDTEEIRFGYCTEFIINLNRDFSGDEDEFKAYLESIGDSIVVVADEKIVKVHVHTDHPGLAFEKALSYGSLSRMKVDNMREEHQERLIQDAKRLALEQKQRERKPYGFIAVSSGQGLSEIFAGTGADLLIEGGQTMNPSTEDMLNALKKVEADTVFILPNNKNIIMAARQAAQLTEDKRVIVIPSATIPQGITALVNFMPDLTPEENERNMIREMGNVKTAQITYAVRSTSIDGIEIKEGDIMGIGDSGILAAEPSVEEAALKSVKALLDEDSELVTIYYGQDVTEEEAGHLAGLIEEALPQGEVDVQNGGQPIYYYMISVE